MHKLKRYLPSLLIALTSMDTFNGLCAKKENRKKPSPQNVGSFKSPSALQLSAPESNSRISTKNISSIRPRRMRVGGGGLDGQRILWKSKNYRVAKSASWFPVHRCFFAVTILSSRE